MPKIEWEDCKFEDAEDLLENIDDEEKDETPPWMKDDNEVSVKIKNLDKIPKLVGTPFGIFQLGSALSPLHDRVFKIAHTDFDVSDEVGQIVCNIPGIDCFKPLSRYKFLVGIAKLFDFNNVKANIELVLLGKENNDVILGFIKNCNETIYKKVVCEKSKLSERYDHWAILIAPNGGMKCSGFQNEEEMDKEISLFNNMKQLTNGYLLSSRSK